MQNVQFNFPLDPRLIVHDSSEKKMAKKKFNRMRTSLHDLRHEVVVESFILESMLQNFFSSSLTARPNKLECEPLGGFFQATLKAF
jgi:hypothetical protein